MGLVAPQHVRNLPGPGIELVFPVLTGGFLSTREVPDFGFRRPTLVAVLRTAWWE